MNSRTPGIQTLVLQWNSDLWGHRSRCVVGYRALESQLGFYSAPRTITVHKLQIFNQTNVTVLSHDNGLKMKCLSQAHGSECFFPILLLFGQIICLEGRNRSHESLDILAFFLCLLPTEMWMSVFRILPVTHCSPPQLLCLASFTTIKLVNPLAK